LDPKKVRRITVSGSKKMVTWDDLNLNLPIAIFDKGAKSQYIYDNYSEFLGIKMWEGDVKLPKINFKEPLKAQNEYFIDALMNGKRVEKSGGNFSAGVVKTLEAVIKSSKKNGTPVRINK
jgi:hypothetical protein